MADDDLAPALRQALEAKHLNPFEGRDVIRCAIEIPGAGGGLRDALRFDPIEVSVGEERVLVMKVRCKKVRFDEVKDTDALTRVMVFEPLDDLTTFIDETQVKDALDEQAERIRVARERAAGVQRLVETNPDGSGKAPDDELAEAEALIVQHNTGVHEDGVRDGCPLCAEEQAAIDRETREAEAGDGTEPTPIKSGRNRK